MSRTIFFMALAIMVALLAGCAAPAGQDSAKLASDLTEAQGKLAAAQSQVTGLQSQLEQAKNEVQTAKADKAAVDSKLSAAQSQVAQLQGQVDKLKQDNQLAGSTPAETAQKIVKFYHETHVYDSYDLYVCGDMAQDVWNMLKAQNINAKIQIGSTRAAVKEITDSDHGWVLAEVAPGSWLALETTGGFAVTQKDNPFYYQGWAFKSPKDFKDYITLLNEYRTRVAIVNDMVARAQQLGKDVDAANATTSQMIAAFNSQYAGKPVSAESQTAQDRITAQKLVVQEKQGRMTQAMSEIDKQKAPMPALLTKMKGLVG